MQEVISITNNERVSVHMKGRLYAHGDGTWTVKGDIKRLVCAVKGMVRWMCIANQKDIES